VSEVQSVTRWPLVVRARFSCRALNVFLLQISLILIRCHWLGSSAASVHGGGICSSFFCGRLCLGCNEALFGLLPVDDAPDVLKVAGSGVLVVDVVGVLPDIDTDDGDDVGGDVGDGVLVGGSAVRQSVLALVVHEPSPAGALNGSCAGVENTDEAVDGTPALDDCVEERAAFGHGTVSLGAE